MCVWTAAHETVCGDDKKRAKRKQVFCNPSFFYILNSNHRTLFQLPLLYVHFTVAERQPKKVNGNFGVNYAKQTNENYFVVR